VISILGAMIETLPLAHVGHYTWVLYVPPVLIVVVSIVRTVISERRRQR
jgi:hypothetical protein